MATSMNRKEFKKLRDDMIRARKNRDYVMADKIKHQINVLKHRIQTQ